MMKKKKFSISSELSKGFSAAINAVENDEGTFRQTVIPLNNIELDPDNPRKLLISVNEIINGIAPNDLHASHKSNELSSIKELANTIKSTGLLNPIVVYKRSNVYRIIAGERRYLASLLINKNEIEARIYDEKPNSFNLKLIQWVENTAREDLSLYERLCNIRDLSKEYSIVKPDSVLTVSALSNIAGLSLSQASCYMSILNASTDIFELIKQKKINNLDKANLIINAEHSSLQARLIQACINGESLKKMRAMISSEKKEQTSKKLGGRPSNKVNMGYTNKSIVIKHIINLILKDKRFKKYEENFDQIDWHRPRQVTQAFKRVVEILEHNLEN